MDAVAYYNKGLSKDQLEDYHGAIADYTMAIEIDPKYAWAYYQRGFAKIRLNQQGQGCIDLKKADELGDEQTHEEAMLENSITLVPFELSEVQQKLFYQNVVSDLLLHQPSSLFDVKLYIKKIYCNIFNINFNSDEALSYARLVPQCLYQAYCINPIIISNILGDSKLKLCELAKEFDDSSINVVYYLFSRYDNAKYVYDEEYYFTKHFINHLEKHAFEPYSNFFEECHWNQSGEFYLVGKYLNGKKEGEWIAYYKDKLIKYIANYHNGLLNGEWVSYHKKKHNDLWLINYGDINKIESKGNIVNNVKEGLWIYQDHLGNDAEKTQGFYINGLKSGEWVIIKGGSDEAIEIINYKEDVLHGKYAFWELYDRGREEKGNYINGNKHGLWEESAFYGGHWYRNSIYYDGKMLESKYEKFDEDGRLEKTEYHVNDKEHGNWKSYFEGKITEDYNYLYGVLHGSFILGTERGNYLYGILHGAFISGTERGNYYLGEKEGEWEYVDWHKVYSDFEDHNGEFRTYDAMTIKRGNYVNGKKEGTWEIINPNKSIRLVSYLNGELVIPPEKKGGLPFCSATEEDDLPPENKGTLPFYSASTTEEDDLPF